MKLKISLFLILLLVGFIGPSHADAICKDGWKSKSNGSGTCSWHGGVLNWLTKSGSAPYYGQDSYYDSSDSGIDPCMHRRYKESRKDCEMRVKISNEMSMKDLMKRVPSLGQTYEEFHLEKLAKKLEKCFQEYGYTDARCIYK